ncbi:flavin reductase family protein [Nonomuraea sp. B5E05]|uniref:flavin reductase family protein n=1 Tax=Nonomuraea sp. B5E05 TaxID=3153569 RepID=UPI0032618885
MNLKRVFAKFPTGVVVVTTVDRVGRRWGFTASSFSSVSMEPPQILVCLARSAQCYQAFDEAAEFAVNILASGQESVAHRFAQHGDDKFAGLDFSAGSRGLPVLDRALATLECGTVARFPAGDHVILLGEVYAAGVGEGDPVLYYDREFRHV